MAVYRWLASVLCGVLGLHVVPRVAMAARWEHAANITVYHVNPRHLGPKPVNMDTGDAVGDLFFDLFEVIIYPLSCPHGPASGGIMCTNPEADSTDLVVNKVVLEVNSQFSGYAKCNIGTNGTDSHGHPCKDDTYCCYCGGASSKSPYGPSVPCNRTVGRECLLDHFGSGSSHYSWCSSPRSNRADCYRAHATEKLSKSFPGYWYSSLAEGYCGDTSQRSNCTWRVVSVEKVVSRACHTKVFGETVQATAPPGCLDSCGAQRHNSSSACWVDCFYKAALGPTAGLWNGTIAGMSMEALVEAWEKPFAPEDHGGCPAIN